MWRKSEIIEQEYEQVDDLKFIQKEDIVITISNNGYIKRSLLENYRSQNRGGKGKTSIKTREEDSVVQTLSVNTHTSVLFFSTEGLAYKIKAWKIF